MIIVNCHVCTKEFKHYGKKQFKHYFCCNTCFKEWNSKRLSEYNKTENPVNKSLTPEQRLKISESLKNTERSRNIKSTTYKKRLGKHIHRIVAEIKIGRELTKREIVHHIDGNKHNNSPDNLQIMNRAEHARVHFKGKKRGGAA